VTRPPLKTRIAGHALVVVPLNLAALCAAYGWLALNQPWPIMVVIGALAGWCVRANEVMTKYKAWKRAWDGLAPSAPRTAWVPWRKAAAIAAVMGVILYCFAHSDQPAYALALGWLVIGAAIIAIVGLCRRLRRRTAKRSAGTDLATVAIRRPLLPVPSLEAAYQALPAHCKQLMGIHS
jgi:hypothetical protein